MNRECVIVMKLCVLLGILILGVVTESTGVRFCHEEKVYDWYDHYTAAHFNASSRVIKDAKVSGDFTCTCTIIAEEDMKLLNVWSKVAVTSQGCNKHVEIVTKTDSFRFSECRYPPKSLTQIPAGQQVRLILKTSTEQLPDDDYLIYVAPEPGTKLTLSCQLPKPSVGIAITTEATTGSTSTQPDVTSDVTTTSTVPSEPRSNKKAVVIGVGVTSGLIVLILMSCLAFCVARRFRRKHEPQDDEVKVGCPTNENSDFKHGLSRKMTRLYNRMISRPLPSIPKSIRRWKQRPLPRELRELRQSGVYNSIKETPNSIVANGSNSHLDATKPVLTSQNSIAGVMNSFDRLQVHSLAFKKNTFKNKPTVKYQLSAQYTQSNVEDVEAAKEATDIAHKIGGREHDYVEPACYITPVGVPSDAAMESNCYMNTAKKADQGLGKCEQNHLKTPDCGIPKDSSKLKIIGKSGSLERLCAEAVSAGVSTPVNGSDSSDLGDTNVYVHHVKVASVAISDYTAEKVYANLAFETEEKTADTVNTENTRVQGSNDKGHVVEMPIVTVDSCGYVPMSEMKRDATGCERDATGCGIDATGCGRDATCCERDATGCGRNPTGCERDATRCGRDASGCGRDATGWGKRASEITNHIMLSVASGHCNSESDTCYSEDDDVSIPYANTSFETSQTGSHVSSCDMLSIPARKSKRLDSGYLSDSSKRPIIGSVPPVDLFPNLIQFRGIDASLKRSEPVAKPDGNHGRGKVKVKRYVRQKSAQTP